MLPLPEETRKRPFGERDRSPTPTLDVEGKLRKAGLRPTRQRIAIGRLLFGTSHRHVTADDLLQEVCATDKPLSLATIYNTLNHFSDAGLVRRISVDAERAHFDTDTGNHHHFYLEGEDRVIDVPLGKISVDRLPDPPEGFEITRVDVVIRLKKAVPVSASSTSARIKRGRQLQGDRGDLDRSGHASCGDFLGSQGAGVDADADALTPPQNKEAQLHFVT